jgi:hypothetical protein
VIEMRTESKGLLSVILLHHDDTACAFTEIAALFPSDGDGLKAILLPGNFIDPFVEGAQPPDKTLGRFRRGLQNIPQGLSVEEKLFVEKLIHLALVPDFLDKTLMDRA